MGKTIQEIFNSEIPLKLEKSGTNAFDKAINGFSLGKVNILSGRPGIGKSSAMLRLAKNYHKSSGAFIHWMSFSDSHFQLGKRYYHLNESDNQFDESKPSINLEKYNHLEFHAPKPMTEILEWLDSVLSDSERVLVVIENNVAFSPPYTMEKALEISEIVKACNERLDGTNHLVFFSFNCSDEAEIRDGVKKPELTDIPYFDYYCHLIDKALTVYRYEYYGFEQDEDGEEVYDKILMTALYNRTGPTAEFKLLHRGVAKRINPNLGSFDNDLLIFKYKYLEFSVFRHLKNLEVVLRDKSGLKVSSKNVSGLEEAWAEILQFLKMDECETEWLNIKPVSVKPLACKFLIGKLGGVFEHNEFISEREKRRFDYWLKMLSEDWMCDDDWLI